MGDKWRTSWICGLLLAGAALCAPVSGEERTVPVRYYRIHTTLDQALAEDLARRMDAMHEEYSRRLMDFRPEASESPLEVHLFRTREEYDRFTKNKYPNTGGVFMAGRKEMLAAFLEGQGRDALRRTLQHEAFHQFAFTRISVGLPIWVNEGIAQFFEEGVWTGREFLVGQVPPMRIRQLQADMERKRLTPFAKFMSLAPDQWENDLTGDGDRGATQYNQAWAMVQCLVSVPEYRPRFIAMLKLLHAGRHPQVAFTEAFSPNIKGFQDRFVEWATQLKPTEEATIMENMDVLADMMASLAGRKMRFSDIRSFKDAVETYHVRLEYARGILKWTTEKDPAVYFSDPEGRLFSEEELRFESRAGAPLADIVCRPAGRLQFRTRFYTGPQGAEHETVVEHKR